MCNLHIVKGQRIGRHRGEGALVEGALVGGATILAPPFCRISTLRGVLVGGGTEDSGWVNRSPPFTPMAS